VTTFRPSGVLGDQSDATWVDIPGTSGSLSDWAQRPLLLDSGHIRFDSLPTTLVYTWDYSSEYLGTGSDWATQHSAIHLGLMVEDALGALGYTNAYTSTQPPAGYPYPGFESLYLGEGWAANLCNPPYAATSALGPGPYLVSLFALSPGLYWDSHGPLRLYEWWIDADIAPPPTFPLRQVQRDDGLGRSVMRARGTRSVQGSIRQRGYR
jgi:hypothetical protein